MPGPLNARIARMEERLPKPARPARIVRIVATDGEEEAAYELARQQGLDLGPDSDDIVIVRLIAAPHGSPPRNKPPYIQSLSQR